MAICSISTIVRYLFCVYTVVGGVITLNDIICQPATTHSQGEVLIEKF